MQLELLVSLQHLHGLRLRTLLRLCQLLLELLLLDHQLGQLLSGLLGLVLGCSQSLALGLIGLFLSGLDLGCQSCCLCCKLWMLSCHLGHCISPFLEARLLDLLGLGLASSLVSLCPWWLVPRPGIATVLALLPSCAWHCPVVLHPRVLSLLGTNSAGVAILPVCSINSSFLALAIGRFWRHRCTVLPQGTGTSKEVSPPKKANAPDTNALHTQKLATLLGALAARLYNRDKGPQHTPATASCSQCRRSYPKSLK